MRLGGRKTVCFWVSANTVLTIKITMYAVLDSGTKYFVSFNNVYTKHIHLVIATEKYDIGVELWQPFYVNAWKVSYLSTFSITIQN